MGANSEKEILYFSDQFGWRDWLVTNFARTEGVRLKLRRKASTLPGVDYTEALEVALCFGWIDGQANSLDENFHLQVFSPRRSRSTWSQTNRDRVARLIADGRMQPPGIAQIEAAKADGRWDAAYARQSETVVPEDLQQAIDANPSASAMFATLSSQNRFAIVFRTNGLKRAETRAAKIAGFVAMLERGETIHPQKPAR
jgi:uncharacterized protein YdeI (YjbR/CyaY-like superfamily)